MHEEEVLMKISALIEELKKLEKRHGNIDVFREYDGIVEDIEYVAATIYDKEYDALDDYVDPANAGVCIVIASDDSYIFPPDCEHESDGHAYLSHPAKLKCKKCGGFYGAG